MSRSALTPRNLEIRDNFDAIAPRYDLTNRVISLGIDLRWRKVAIEALADLPARGRVLDLACGTCDLALEILRRHPDAGVVGVDLSRAMLGLARAKLTGRAAAPARRASPIHLVNAPAEALPFWDGSFDAVTIGFGIRNVPDYRLGLREMLRVLRPGGRVVILEFSTPPSRLLWKVYNYYFFHVLPHIGGWLTGHQAAYRYLTDSVSRFPGAPALKADLEAAGFARVEVRSLFGGIACIHTGVRP